MKVFEKGHLIIIASDYRLTSTATLYSIIGKRTTGVWHEYRRCSGLVGVVDCSEFVGSELRELD